MAAWLPPAPGPPDTSGMRWWEPAGVREQLGIDEWESVSYIVVDELHEHVAGLVVMPWPRVDGKGRLVFDDEDHGTRVATSEAAMTQLLRSQRRPVVPIDVDARTEQQLVVRPLAIGDAFAACVRQ